MTRLLISIFSLQLPALLFASTLTWSETPADTNWFNPLNWDGGNAPSDGDSLIFSLTNTPSVVINGGGNLSITDITFPDATFASGAFPQYEIRLTNSANLTVTGSIINRTPSADVSTTAGQALILTGGSTLAFTGNANASSGAISSGNRVRIVNRDGSIILSDNATLGSAYYYNAAPARGGNPVLLSFTGNSHAGNAIISNSGENAVIRFTDNSGTQNSIIYNRGPDSFIIFDGNSSHTTWMSNITSGTISGKIYNMNAGTRIIFTGNSHIAGGQVFNTGANSPFRHAIVNIGTLPNISDIVNNGTFSTIHIGGENVTASNLTVTNSGNFSTTYISDTFTATNFFSASQGRSATTFLESLNGKITLDGGVWMHAMQTGAGIYIGQNVIMTAHGNLTANSTATGTLGNTAAWIMIGGNAGIINDGKGEFNIVANSTSLGSTVIITGDANLYNVRLRTGAGRNPLSTADRGLALDDPAWRNHITINGHASVTANASALMQGNFSHITIAGNTTYTSRAASGTAFSISANYAWLDILDDAVVDTDGNLNASGNNIRINIAGNATYTTTGNLNASGNNITLTIDGHANYTTASSIATLTGSNITLDIRGNATVTASAAANIFGNNTTVTIGGNATVSGPGNATTLFSLRDTAITIRDNATLRDGRLDLYNAGASLRIEGNPLLENIRLLSRATQNITLAINEGHSVTLDTIHQAIPGETLTFHFTGNKNQTLQYNGLAGSPDLAFTEDDGLRATVINNAVSHSGATITALTLNRQNTITGEFVILNGTVTANHINALDTATLNITTGGTLSYGATINTAGELTLGGLAGDGTLSVTLPEIKTGNNNSDSSFGGTLSGSGNLTKIGSGTLTFDKVDLSAYTGQIAVTDGALAFANSAIIENLAAAGPGQIHLAANSVGDYAALSVTNLALDTLTQIRVAPSQTAVFADGDKLENIIGIANLNNAAFNADDSHGLLLKTHLDNAQAFRASANGTGALDLVYEQQSYTGFAATSNQRTIAAALDHLYAADNHHPLAALLNQLPGSQLPDAFGQFNPSALTSIFQLALQQARREHTQIANRLQDRTPAPNTSGDKLPSWTAYFTLADHRGGIDSSTNSPGYDIRHHGITIGLETPLAGNNALAGVAFTYDQARADLDSSTGRVDLDAYRLTAYLGLAKNNYHLQIQTAVSNNQYDTRRHIPILAETATGDTDALQFSIGAEVGQTFRLRPDKKVSLVGAPRPPFTLSLTPLIRADYDHLRLKAFAETDSLAALRYPAQNSNHLETQLALRLAADWATASESQITATLQLGWAHNFTDDFNRLRTRFAESPSAFTVEGPATSRDAAHIALSLRYRTAKFLHAALAFESRINSDESTHALSLTLGKQF